MVDKNAIEKQILWQIKMLKDKKEVCAKEMSKERENKLISLDSFKIREREN